MRQTYHIPAMVLGLLMTVQSGFTEPIIGGRFIEKPPAVLGEKPLFLAHCYNPDAQAIKSSNFQVGLEMQSKSGKKVYVLKPGEDLVPGQIRTYKFRITPNAKEKKGVFRLFTRIAGETHFSDSYSFSSGSVRSQDPVSIPIYTEAPPETNAAPPEAVPFENENNAIPIPIAQPTAKPIQSVETRAKPVTEFQASRPKTLDPKEFKTLHTIDEELVIYVVKKGDTLKAISEKCYGSPSKEKAIADFNFIENPASIKSGEEIIVDVLPLKRDQDKGKNLDSANSDQILDESAPRQEKSPAKAKKSSKKKTKTASLKVEPNTSEKYVIKTGDTLATIAKQFYGKASFAARILKANPGLNTRNLRTGKEISLPTVEEKRA